MTAVTILFVVFGVCLWLIALVNLIATRDESTSSDGRPEWFGMATRSAPWAKGHYVEQRNAQPSTPIRPLMSASRAYLLGGMLGFLGTLPPRDSYLMTIDLFMTAAMNGILWGFAIGVVILFWMLVKKWRLSRAPI